MGPSSQYFWQETSGTDAGAHITEVPKEEWQDSSDPNYHSGGNVLANTNAISVRDGLADLASFGANGAIIGQNVNGQSRSIINANGMQVLRKSGGNDTQIVNLGYGDGTNGSGGVSTTPYFTLGIRTTTTAAYDSSSTYSVGDLCVYSGDVYVCKNAITTPEAWNSSNWMLAKGNYSVVAGEMNISSGFAAFSEGSDNIAIGHQSHAEGGETKAINDYSHAEGLRSTASGYVSHAEGMDTIAKGGQSHAEGNNTKANNSYSHAEGRDTTAGGTASHAEGYGCEIAQTANNAHAQNYYTIANKAGSTVLGTYNEADTSVGTIHPNGVDRYGTYAVIVGNGVDENTRSNILTLDWLGNAEIDGNVTAVNGAFSGNVTAVNGAFSGTVTMENHTDPIGWFDSISNTVSKATGTAFTSISGSAYTPTAGRYLVTASAMYSGATSGNRGVCIYQGGSVSSSTQVITPAIPSASWSTDLKTMGYFVADGSTEFRIGLLQNSGSSLSTSYTLTFIRIR
jgi:roadblock/LC7 domain-containing protein